MQVRQAKQTMDMATTFDSDSALVESNPDGNATQILICIVCEAGQLKTVSVNDETREQRQMCIHVPTCTIHRDRGDTGLRKRTEEERRKKKRNNRGRKETHKNKKTNKKSPSTAGRSGLTSADHHHHLSLSLSCCCIPAAVLLAGWLFWLSPVPRSPRQPRQS